MGSVGQTISMPAAMLSPIPITITAFISWLVYKYISGLYRNVARAKSSGLPYCILPMSPINPIAQLTSPVWVRLLKLLTPKSYSENVADICTPNWQFKHLRKPFQRIGDTFLMVTPTGIMMITENADLIHQATTKRDAFPKPIEHYSILSLFGENLVTSEGAVWKMHRKVVSPSFNETNAALVFKASIQQAQGMLASWDRRKVTNKIKSVEQDTMTLALNVIGYVGFGVRFLWDKETLPADTDPKMVKYASLDVPEGHTLNFKESIAKTLEYLLIILMVPPALLGWIPMKAVKAAKRARDNYLQYMHEFIKDKAEDVREGDQEIGMDLMGSLVATSYQDKQAKTKAIRDTELTDSEIIGNAFIIFVAGHETSANVLHFALLELANNPAAQRRLQRDVDALLGRDSDPAAWDYEAKVGPMMASMLGAVQNETLRMMPPVIEVPKKVSPQQDQIVSLGDQGRQHALPAGAYLGLNVVAAHRNPRYWPTRPSRITGADDDLNDWVPERWFRDSSPVNETKSSPPEEGEGEENATPEPGASQLFRPAPGAFLPFSLGARACIGRRVAQVEILAALAVVFQRYSVENCVDDWADGERVARMTPEEMADVYRKATARSRETMARAQSLITLKLKAGDQVPIRLVKRGEERFVSWLDA
ncbi:cytochrome P450 [Xylariomycetidae sp. FL0641]|nr:cytochrome P450 [Xylariomycetidae sp. FL0641]